MNRNGEKPDAGFVGQEETEREWNEAIASINKARSELSDDALALQFAAMYRDRLRYVAKWGQWWEWDGEVWREDSTVNVFDLTRQMLRDVGASLKEKQACKVLTSAKTVASVERLARTDRRHAATVDQWDADLWALNTPGGIVDLRSGELRRHDPHRYMTKITAVAPGGGCPRWLQFLDEITTGNQSLIEFLQRLVGYGLTGSVREHAFAFFYGTGANGKGTFLNTITALLGDYSAVAPTDVFTEAKGERHPTELAMLRGARFVSAQETEEGHPWAESRIKAVTGGDPITARFMRQDFFTYDPQFKLIIAGNHKPQLRNVDEAMRRRLYFVPFLVTFPKEGRDLDLFEKLEKEWPGILAWMIAGCLAWQDVGLDPPDIVREATAECFRDQDVLLQWIEDCCETGPACWEAPRLLFNSWAEWCRDRHEDPKTEKSFAGRLERAGFPGGLDRARGGRYRQGIKLRNERL